MRRPQPILAPVPIKALKILFDRQPGLKHAIHRPTVLNRNYAVPYFAGLSEDGATLYINQGAPDTFKLSDGRTADYSASLARHEVVEWWLMQRLGWDYFKAHDYAWTADSLKFCAEYGQGFDDEWQAFAEIQSVASEKQARNLVAKFPPDLYLGPYESDIDAQDQQLISRLRAARGQSYA